MTNSILRSVSTLALAVAVAGVLGASEAAAQTAGANDSTTGGATLGNSAPSGGVSPGTGTTRTLKKRGTAPREPAHAAIPREPAHAALPREPARAGIAPRGSGLGPSGIGREGVTDEALRSGVTGPNRTGLANRPAGSDLSGGEFRASTGPDLGTGLGGGLSASGGMGSSSLYASPTPPGGLSTGDTLSSQRAGLPPSGLSAPPPSSLRGSRP
jgi:hypothetical protein